MPYGFPSGQGLLQMARDAGGGISRLVSHLSHEEQRQLPTFVEALSGTLDKSLDAMLETRSDVTALGKAFMARALLNSERAAKIKTQEPEGAWYRELWAAISARSLEEVARNPLTIVTFNYDRSLEYSLIRALHTRTQAPPVECAQALSPIGPIHLHGSLGPLPEQASKTERLPLSVPYGGDGPGVTANNCADAARSIRIIHEAQPHDEAFALARRVLSSAERIVFLGFGYARQNVERLQLLECANKNATMYLCARGFTAQQQVAFIRPFFGPWGRDLRIGSEDQDIVEFLRHYPDALI